MCGRRSSSRWRPTRATCRSRSPIWSRTTDTTATLAREQQRGRWRSDRAGESLAIDDPMWPIRAVLDGTSATPIVVDLDPTATWPSWPVAQAARARDRAADRAAGQTRPAGVFIAGLNPYRPVDAELSRASSRCSSASSRPAWPTRRRTRRSAGARRRWRRSIARRRRSSRT